MTIALGHPVAVGDAVIAALVRNSISGNQSARHVWFTGSRSAVALLVRRGAEVTAFTPQGDPLQSEDIERLCPGAIDQFLSAEPS